jgi:transcriptional regulator with PAS, ATPase and Fis domain
MKPFKELLKIASKSSITVLLQGESGTGKEVAARFLHREGDRCRGPFVALNCGAIAKNLAESTLEGAKKGAFTGATADQPGVVRSAHGGTLFLDEIGEMPFDMQSKMLRILQERSVLPLGATQSEPVDFRLVCATNRDLQIEINDGNFRKDLYFRLNAFPIVIPPLRDRDDFADIVKNVWSDISERTFAECIPLRDKQIEMLSKYKWPGNIRQLKNVLQRYALLKQHDITLGEVLAEEFSRTSLNDREFVNDYPTQRASAPNWSFIQKALFENRGNKSKAAKSLNISRGCLCYQIKKHEFQNNWDPCEKLQKYSLA